VHASQFSFAGTAIDRPLLAADGFLAKYAFPAEAALASQQQASSTYAAALDELTRHGTTTAVIFASAHVDTCRALVSAVVARGGPRAFVGKVNMDRFCPDDYVETTEQSLVDTAAFIKYVKAANANASPPLVVPVVTPRFLPTCTPQLLRGLGELAAEHQVPVQSHMSESCDEVAFSASLFDGQTDAAVFDSFGLLRAPSVLAHCVHLQEGEEELLHARGAAIAHCPLSNFFFAKAALPVKQLVRRGIKVGLGTDVAGGYSPSMLHAIRTAVLAAKTLQFSSARGCAFSARSCADEAASDAERLHELHDLSHFDAFWLATMGGAQAIGLDGQLGSFEVGKSFDAVTLSTGTTVRQYAGGIAESAADLLQKILTLGDDRNVLDVFVAGACLKKGESLVHA